jgi:hypothetical protein
MQEMHHMNKDSNAPIAILLLLLFLFMEVIQLLVAETRD